MIADLAVVYGRSERIHPAEVYYLLEIKLLDIAQMIQSAKGK